ncbi:MAG: hypothetical protein MK110_15735 [Fuerstiella sp.]|nr:hypothetical protein [Fuerstiella sp.]
MKNLKPFILGSIAGCGMMFVALQYHLVRSQEGFQLIPRAPQAALGLAWADVREWDIQKWSDRPELARAAVSHGSSGLISESVAGEIKNSLETDSGTVGHLRSLLNGSLSVDFDAPVFGPEDPPEFGNIQEDRLAIPFPDEAASPRWEESLTDQADYEDSWSDVGDHTWSRSDESGPEFNSGFSQSDEYESSDSRRPWPRDGYVDDEQSYESGEWSESNPFSVPDPSWDSASLSHKRPRSTDTQEARLRQTTTLEDLLFEEREETVSVQSVEDSEFNSVTRALDSRAARSLNRVDNRFPDHADSHSRSGEIRQRKRSESSYPRAGDARERRAPNAIRALREGYDPFRN